MNNTIESNPPNNDDVKRQQETAVGLIRSKLDTLYEQEPSASEELSEVESVPAKQQSKHQRYMQQLSSSGRSLAEIQVAWHEYYAKLSDKEKHEVWHEFYSEHARTRAARESKKPDQPPQPKAVQPHQPQVPISNNTAAARKHSRRGKRSQSTAGDIKNHVLSQVEARGKVTKNPHVRSLMFGVSMGVLTVLFLLFGFFNERFITPFIRPNTNVSATPIIVDPQANGPVGPEAKIIIPKINVEAPVVYDVPSISESDVQKGLERGVVHYITTPNPGEKGNAVIFGHSSSNILNKGKYKFAFIMLKSLDKDDTFIVQKDGKRYVYKIYEKFVVKPDDLSVLGPTNKTSTVTLITCDPPGTSTNRLIIRAEQIFPDPSANKESSIQQNANTQQPRQLPSNSISMWQRITGGL